MPLRRRRADQDRHVALDRLRIDLRRRDPVEAAVEGHRVRSPHRPQRGDDLLEAGALAAGRHANGLELLPHPALAETGDHPFAAELVERREPAPEHDRRVQQRVDHAGAQLDPAGQGGHVAECLQRLEHVPVDLGGLLRFGDVRHDDLVDRPQQPLEGPDGGVAEAFRLLRDADDGARRRLVAARRQRDPQFHDSSWFAWIGH
jgi:hypothetical protein